MIKKIDRKVVRRRKQARVRRKIHGTASRPRLSVFRSLKHIYAQLIDDERGVTLASSSGGANVEAAREAGRTIGERALEAGITEVVFDRSGYIYHGRVAALADAAREAGLKF